MKRFTVKCLLLLGTLGIASCSKTSAQYQYPFQNTELPVEQRIDNIISLLTLDEKIKCLSTNPSIERLGIKGTGHIEGLHGVALGGPAKWGRNHPVTTTQFPQAYGLGATWDPEIMRKVGEAEGYEARYIFQSEKYKTGALVVRSPNADLGRDPRWGRTEECYGEDPYLTATMATAMIKGLQGNDPNYWQTAALMKHFLANSNENGRDSSSSNFDERLFYEYYAFPFFKGIEDGGSKAFMAAYNSWNGTPMMIHPALKEIAIKKWNQDGIICTDGGALGLLIKSHHYDKDIAVGAAAAVKAGINQFLDDYDQAIRTALNQKLLTEEEIDRVIKGNFRVMIKLGLLDPPGKNPYAAIKDGPEPWLSEKHKRLAREVTQKSIVLLKNERNLLPLNRNQIKSVAVIGAKANDVFLDWYSGTPPYVVTPLDGIKSKLNDKTSLVFAENNVNNAAVNAAKNKDVVIMVVGNHPTCNAGWADCPDVAEGKEAVDRQSLDLTDEELIKEVYKVNQNIVVVLMSNFPYAINWTQANIPAIVQLTHNSEELGNGLADVLFGDYNPGGRLTQTWPKSVNQLPDMMDYNIRNGHTYMYTNEEPLYPFGYGKSYTSFEYKAMKTGSVKLKTNGTLKVSVTVRNSGKRTGDEVVQLYVSHLDSKVTRPKIELKGFKRITLKSGEVKTVDFELPALSLAYWNQEQQKFIVEEDKVKVMVGTSSAEIKFEQIINISN